MITLSRLAAAQYKGLVNISLRFPERGSILIEGRNEAGKSTLFDAVHFGLYGRPLVGDRADAIHYGADRADVELDLTVDGTHLEVKRSLHQTAKTLQAQAELRVTRGEDVETVRGPEAVSRRLQLELGGLTAEALLNSCLVAQKQLGRLETLGRASREEALTVLLNLGKLSEVHSRIRVRPEDEDQLRRARARVDLARVSSELATLEVERKARERQRSLAELKDVVEQLQLVEAARAETVGEAEALRERLRVVRADLEQAALVRAQLDQLQRLTEMQAHRDALERNIAQLDEELGQLEELRQALPQTRAALEDAMQQRSALLALIEARTRRDATASEAERIEARLNERAELLARCARLDDELAGMRVQHRDLQAALAQLSPLVGEMAASRERQERLSELQRTLAAAIEARAGLEAVERRATQAAQLLGQWVERRRREETALQVKRLLDDLALGVTAVEHAETSAGGRRGTSGLRLRLLLDHPLTGALALQLVLWPGGGELADVRAVTGKEAERLSSSGVPTLSAAGLEEAQRQRETLALQLSELAEKEPRNEEDAERRRAALESGTERRLAELKAIALEAQCLKEAAALRVAESDSLEQLAPAIAAELRREAARQAELSVSAGRREGLQGQLALLERNGKERRREQAECQASLERDSEDALRRRGREVAEQLATLDAELVRLAAPVRGARTLDVEDRAAVQARVEALAAEVAVMDQRLQQRDVLVERRRSLRAERDEWREALERARTEVGVQDEGVEERRAVLARMLEGLDEQRARDEEQAAERASGGAEARLQRLEHDAGALLARATQLAAQTEVELPANGPADVVEWANMLPALRDTELSRPEIEGQLRALDQRRGALERGATEAATLLGDEGPLELEEMERALRELEQELAARKRGQEIVSLTRQRMISKVLPNTIDNMCVLLPMLTGERYRYAELTPEYRLQVWDERKRAFVEKTLFSGGTQDQFSLALRLGFALAALPRELGTSPGFLFLDEPLSSFDRDRTQALVGLLTTGQVATFFRQVFLISHSQAFDATLFSHHIVMEHGRAAESTLPA